MDCLPVKWPLRLLLSLVFAALILALLMTFNPQWHDEEDILDEEI